MSTSAPALSNWLISDWSCKNNYLGTYPVVYFEKQNSTIGKTITNHNTCIIIIGVVPSVVCCMCIYLLRLFALWCMCVCVLSMCVLFACLLYLPVIHSYIFIIYTFKDVTVPSAR